MTHPIGGARRSASVLLVLLGLLPASAHGSGDFNRWLPATGPEGGNATQLAIDPTNGSRVFAIVSSSSPFSGSLYRTTDGTHWQLLRTAGQVTLDPSKPMTMYVVDNFNVAKSTDGGDTWTALSVPCSASHLVIEPKRPSTIYAAYSGVCASTDGGATWKGNTLSDNYVVEAVAVDPQTPGTLYAVTQVGSLFKSTDGAASWTLASGAMSTNVLKVSPGSPNLLLAAGGAVGLGRSLNGGQSWSFVDTFYGVAVRSLLFNPVNPSQVFAAASGGLYVSGDGGGTWARRGSAVELNDVAIDLGRPGRLYAASSVEEVLRSADSGSTWEPASSGIAVASCVIGMTADPNAPDTVYALRSAPVYPPARTDLFRSTDAGQTWTLVSNSLPGSGRFSSLLADPRVSDVLYGSPDGAGGVYRSTDGGRTWQLFGSSSGFWTIGFSGLGSGGTPFLFAEKYTNLSVYSTGSLYRIRTDSLIWESVGTSQGPIALDPADEMLIYESRADGFYKSTDGMRSWVRVAGLFGGPGPFQCFVNPLSRSDLYCAGSRQTVRSTDGGQSWTKLTGGLLDKYRGGILPVPDPRDLSTLYIPGYRSRNKGDTWSAIGGDSGGSEGSGVKLVFSSGTRATLYAATSNSGVQAYHFAGPGNPYTSALLVPIVLSAGGLAGSSYSSELTLTNRGTSPAALDLTYTPAFGGGGGTARDTLPAGTQKVFPDAIEYLKSLRLPIPDSGNRGGSLLVTFSGLSARAAASALVRTTTAVPEGRAGLAYAGVPLSEALGVSSYLWGLRQNADDRSNVALVNAGRPEDGDVTLRVSVFPGVADHEQGVALDDVRLSPGGFFQFTEILKPLGLATGYARVEKVTGAAPYYAYAVINDQANSDGSFVPPMPERAWNGTAPLSLGFVNPVTLPAVVETPAYATEVVFASSLKSDDRSPYISADVTYTTDQIANPTSTITSEIALGRGTQLILPNLVERFRRDHPTELPLGRTYAGSLDVRFWATLYGTYTTQPQVDPTGVFVGARISNPAPLAGGRYGVFYSAVPAGECAATVPAWLYGLQQNGENRTNLAIVNNWETDPSDSSTFRIELFDGDTGLLAATIDDVVVPPGIWKQFTAILSTYAPSVRQGWAKVSRTQGKNSFLAYAVSNDGAAPGQRSGDGAYVPMALGE